MNYPVCVAPLSVIHRQGVEIDFCPRCRGVWLDRGELDKIVERSARYSGSDRDDDDDDGDWGDDRRQPDGPPPPDYRDGGYPAGGQYPPKKKEGVQREQYYPWV
ncbi:MAG: zf-TFIIB domain-containing protein [Fimbriiglobus sp.]